MMLHAIDVNIHLRDCVWPFLVSISVNNLVPFRAGDLVRIIGFRTQLSSSPMARTGTLLIERLLDLLVLLSLLFTGILLVGSSAVPEKFIIASSVIALVAIFGLVLLLLMPRKLLFFIMRILGYWRWVDHPVASRLRRFAEQLFESLEMLNSSSLILRLLAVSFIAWFFEGCVFLASAWSLSGYVPFDGAWLALTTGTLATLLPSSPGYVGTFDYFVMKAVQAAGSGIESAAAFALLVHMILWLPMTLAGALYFLFPRGRSIRKVTQGSPKQI